MNKLRSLGIVLLGATSTAPGTWSCTPTTTILGLRDAIPVRGHLGAPHEVTHATVPVVAKPTPAPKPGSAVKTSPPEVAAPTLPYASNPVASFKGKCQSYELPQGRRALFCTNGMLWVTEKDGAPAWSMALPDAQGIEIEKEAIVVDTIDGRERLSFDGNWLSTAPEPGAAPYAAPLSFARVLREPVTALHRTRSGSIWGIVGGGAVKVFPGTPKPPKHSRQDGLGLRTFLAFPKGPTFAIGDDSYDGGAWAPMIRDVEGQSDTLEPSAIGMGRLLVASNEDRTVWHTSSGMLSKYRQEEPELIPMNLAVSALGLQDNQIVVGGPAGAATSAGDADSCFTNCLTPNVKGSEWQVLTRVSGSLVPEGVHLAGPITAMGNEGKRLWVSGKRQVAWRESGQWITRACPLEIVHQFWSPGPGEMWAVGIGGAAYFDGTSFSRVLGVSGEGLGVVGTSQRDVWIATTTGLYHGTKGNSLPVQTILLKGDSPAGPARGLPREITIGRSKAPVVKRYELPKVGGRAFHPHAASWIGSKMVLSNAKVQMLWSPSDPTQLAWFGDISESTLCFDCAGQDDRGQSFTIHRGGMLSPSDPKLSDGAPNVGRLRGITQQASRLWFLGGPQEKPPAVFQDERTLPTDARGVRLASRAAGSFTQYVGLPNGHYFGLSARSATNFWVVGALEMAREQYQQVDADLPDGEGLVFHVEGEHLTHFRSPLGTLFSVAAVSEKEAWAVGTGGQLLHLTDHVEGFQLPARTYLRSILATPQGDLWVVGDKSTILRYRRGKWENLTSPAVAPDQSLTRVLLGPEGAIWILGFDGLYRVNAN